jgi:hypothetical protein
MSLKASGFGKDVERNRRSRFTFTPQLRRQAPGEQAMANIPALMIGAAASAAVSMTAGFLIGSYATAGVVPTYAHSSPRIAEAWSPPPETWPAAADLADPLGRYATERASGSSRL